MNSPDYAIVLLAAGNSTRMGAAKQLLDYRGMPLIRHAVETALRAQCMAVVVVLGANAAAIRAALDALPPSQKHFEIVENPRWAEGMGTSIQAGIHTVERLQLDGAILALADQPLITSEILDRLAAEHGRTGQPIVASQYAGTVGVPVYFAKSHFDQLLALPPEQGCKAVILKNAAQAIRLDCPEAEIDIDTPAEYAAAIAPTT